MSEFTKEELLFQIDAARAAMQEQFAGLNGDEKEMAERMSRAWAEIRFLVDTHK